MEEASELYAAAARDSAELAQYWATEAKRITRSFDPIALVLFSFAANFLITLLLVTITR
jgi:hypothetical protein